MRRVICKACGETEPHYAHGMCKRCYRRWLAEDSRRECLGCHRVMRMHSRGLCTTCYKRLLRDRTKPDAAERQRPAIDLDEWRDYIDQCRGTGCHMMKGSNE